MNRKHIQLTSKNRCVTLYVTDWRRTLRIGRRASRTACDAERRTIVEPGASSTASHQIPTDSSETAYANRRVFRRFASLAVPQSCSSFGRGFRWVENSMRA
ncbi:DUF1534 domain-containing protein [Pseudomonas syringae pv. maculicola str. ES4326]|uniref:DUF1534 domain-containing protein n=1 Tax=Pseudomonas syringae pv. maculicola str. ES4326 TaxID=629265 RepID=A0A8T8BZA0_PSEYM|nr:DUF1534 domain-containing protein [Pseudomonas syringae pv. maculicola str. ES4326]